MDIPQNTSYDTSDDDSEDSLHSSDVFSASNTGTSGSIPTDFSRSSSPSPSVRSMTSSMRASIYKQEYGRVLNAYSDVYRLPADEQELERLDRQNALLELVMGRYPPPFHEVMADDPSSEEPKAILDLGCGSGAWIMQAARDFPHSSCVAVDLVPMNSPRMPLNCRSEVDDINLGLEHFYNLFNVVHCRLISTGIQDYPHLINQVAWVLRPGGLLIATDVDCCLYNDEKQRIIPSKDDTDESWVIRWFSYLVQALRHFGSSPDVVVKIPSLIAPHRLFEDVVVTDYYLPISPWEGITCEREKDIGERTRADILSFMESGRPLLLGMGMDLGFVEEIERNAQEELFACRFRHYLRFISTYCRKKSPKRTASLNHDTY